MYDLHSLFCQHIIGQIHHIQDKASIDDLSEVVFIQTW